MSILKTNNSGMVQYFICSNGNDVYHPVILYPDNTLETGQPYIEAFENEPEFLARLVELGYSIEGL